MLREEPRSRLFFAALTQSSVGTGAGYIALLVIAFERLSSPWAIAVVLAAELLPAMVLGPVFGAAADRWSQRTCCVLADLVRAVAFVGIALVPSFGATVGFALLAGCGTALFTPAALCALPTLVSRDRLPAATSLFGAITDLGYTAGPALAAAAFLVVDVHALLIANAATFAVSAVVLRGLAFGRNNVGSGLRAGPRALLRDAREGLTIVGDRPVVRIVLGASGLGLLCAGLFNVAELPFVTDILGAREATFSLLAALFGAGFLIGSFAGSGGGSRSVLQRRYLLGLFMMAAGLTGLGLAPGVAVAACAFVIAGLGNGLMLVHERLLIQELVPGAKVGRVYGIKDSVTAWAFATAFVLAGIFMTAVGVRETILGGGAVAFVTWVASALALRRASGGHLDATGEASAGGQHGTDFVDRGDQGLVLLDDFGEHRDDVGIELAPGVRR